MRGEVKLPEPWRWGEDGAIVGEECSAERGVMLDDGNVVIGSDSTAGWFDVLAPAEIVLAVMARETPALVLRAAAEVLRTRGLHDGARRLDYDAARLEAEGGGDAK